MKSYRRLHENSWLLLLFFTAVVFLSAGCSSSSSSSDGHLNPLGAYQTETPTGSGLVVNGDGSTQTPGAISSPIISIPDGTGTIDGHDNAPLLDNMHPGWQQAACLTCHNDTTLNPDHNYTDSSLCYLCHGTNGLPGFGDNIPPIINGVVTSVSDKKATISWKTDEVCLSRLVVRTSTGDRLEFPVSMTYLTGHKYELTGLVPETLYTYEIICTDKSGNRTSTTSFGNLTFTTLTLIPEVEAIDSGEDDTTEETIDDTIFTSLLIQADGSFKCKIKFDLSSPAFCRVYFVRKASNSLADDQVLAGGQAVTNVDYIYSGLQPDTEYIVYIEARESGTDKLFKSRKETIKTDPFS
ncbi:MAG: hypothetical protein CVV42_11900 [Candidatus Riflebacteria bacterium HGW-Riflebacteria-2]|jgi:hypothetical protein|nr:MAG: hypothetical protein CVV42_11900 [Candidatus Riflebacteria bacterium HGW-Riflebacteria-2]